MKHSQMHYQSYLLRLWSAEKQQDWRIMLENIGTHQRHGFADLESFFSFIRKQTREEFGGGEIETANSDER